MDQLVWEVLGPLGESLEGVRAAEAALIRLNFRTGGVFHGEPRTHSCLFLGYLLASVQAGQRDQQSLCWSHGLNDKD